MMTSKSPAVVEFENQQTGHQPLSSDAPQPNLETTVQATGSDAFTELSTPETTVSPALDSGAETQAPLVDVALASVRNQTGSGASAAPAEELAAMRAELNRLSESMTEIGSASVRVLQATREDIVEELRGCIKARPVRSIVLGLLAGFLFGATR